MTITQVQSKLAELLAAHGDISVDLEISFEDGSGIRRTSRGAVHGVALLEQEGVFKKALISTDDGNAA